jgi:long-chain fatty acid transport protein
MRKLLLSSAAFAVLLAAGEAAASGFMIRETSAESVATANSGDVSRADSASTAFNNPAGMVRLRGSQIETGAVVAVPSIKFEGSASVLGVLPVPGNNGGNAGPVALIPHFYGVMDLTPDIKVGLSVNAPFGSTAHYDDGWYGRYLENKTVALALDINPSIAFRLNDVVSVGAGVSAQYFRLDAAANFPQFAIFGPGTPDGVYNFKADGWTWGYNVGILVDLGHTRIGATYRSEMDHEIEGALDFANMNPLLGTVSGPANANANLPASATAGFTHQLTPFLSLSGQVQWTGWSSFEHVTIESANPDFVNYVGYEDSWMASIGGVYRYSDRLDIKAGFGWDGSPVSDQYRTVAVPDTDRYMLGFGLGYRFNPALTVDASFAHYIAAEKANMNLSANNTDPFTQAVILNGEYDNALNYFGLSFRWAPAQ